MDKVPAWRWVAGRDPFGRPPGGQSAGRLRPRRARLEAGNVDQALAETMRCPALRAPATGSARPGDISRLIVHSTKSNPPRCCLRPIRRLTDAVGKRDPGCDSRETARTARVQLNPA